MAVSKLYRRFRVREHPYGLPDALHALGHPVRCRYFRQLRHGPKARYGWVANPYGKPLPVSLPTGTFTLQDAQRFPRRDNACFSGEGTESA